MISWLRKEPSPEEEAALRHRTETVCGWLTFILIVWVAQYHWDMIVAALTPGRIATIMVISAAVLLVRR